METFVWADGARPTRGTLPAYVAFFKALGFSSAILLLNDTDEKNGDGSEWEQELLVATCQALREEGLKVHWMFWMRSTKGALEAQLRSLHDLYRRFAPDGVQFDVEEHWRPAKGKEEALVRAFTDGIKKVHARLSLPLTSVFYSVTCITRLMARAFTAEDAAWLTDDLIRGFFGQSYLFWKPVEQHWSHGLPRQEGRLWELVYGAVDPYLERGQIEQVYVGNACYMQNIPGVSGLDGMRWGIDWTRRKMASAPAYKGCGWWSRKHLIGHAAAPKRALVREASGLAAATSPLPVDSGQAPWSSTAAMAFNARAARVEQLPPMALEHYPGLRDERGSLRFSEAVLAFQADEGLTQDGKLGSGTLAALLERFTVMVGPPMPGSGSFPWAQIQLALGASVRRPHGPMLTPLDTAATDWRLTQEAP
jgi:hypothetical protein